MGRIITLARLGLLALVVGVALSLIPAGRSSLAQELPPRPEPTAAPTSVPTAPPASEEPEDSRERATPAPAGRITGTVVDATTGAPVPGVKVYVGGEATYSDASGNYLRDGLPAGSYTVWVPTGPGLPTPGQPLVVVALGAGATVVQHLSILP